MFGASSSSASVHALRSSRLTRAACALSTSNRTHAGFIRFSSAESAAAQQRDGLRTETLQVNKGGSEPVLDLVGRLAKQYTTSSDITEENRGSSHFNTARNALNLKSSKQRTQSPPKLKVKPRRGRPGTGKTAKRKLKRDVKTLELLVGAPAFSEGSGLIPEDWGEDKLRPSTENISTDRRGPHKPSPHFRKIEGSITHADNDVLEEIEPPTGRAAISTLAHGLERVLFNPGVHWVQDSRSRVYNFTPYVQNVPDMKDFGFERLPPFIRSSRDAVMRNLATAKGKRFAGSTSSLSGLLCHIYFLLSQDHEIDVSTLPEPFLSAKRNFTPAQRWPSAVVYNYKNGVYMIDSDSTDNDDSQWNILTWMGTMLENFFTLPRDEFSKLLFSKSPMNTFQNQPQAYRYTQSGSFVMRSQLDCIDHRLPGSGVFDIKTRAALPIRLDNFNFKENSGYLITSQHGALHSFDKEYYDLIRSAFLKYSFQVRIGGMDGIFLAYHNTARVFGFQYVPLEEMDDRLFGDYKSKKPSSQTTDTPVMSGREVGWRIFNKCVSMLEVISAEIVECFPERTVTCLVETRPGTGIMHIWIQPVDEKAPELDSEDNEIPIVGTDSEKPIVQLDITTRSYLGNRRAARSSTVFSSRQPWSVHWSIARSVLPEKSIRQLLAAAKKRKDKPKAYPEGVNAGNLEEFLKGLGFGDPEALPDLGGFREPDPGIKMLRKISKAGRLETERLQLEDEAKGIKILPPVDLIDPPLIPSVTDSVEQNKTRGNSVKDRESDA
ncbi:hypothetical protein A7U60_g2892 [Sanghuangporus baumii]|uniref:Pet127-domain-containing protein n=1 Tax=Sanghuangporus baumii TaxID=108892 RepID=A0A9Q5I1C0_SANBA|nr:hypothetical protein A7U60_g2892 [Sanghuangporus baumii]